MTSLAASKTRANAEATAWLASKASGRGGPGAVFLHAPSYVFQAPGGGENQLVRTALALEALGVEIRPFSPWIDRLDDARVLHLFGMSREGLELARVARARHVPVVVSTICWYDPRALAALAKSWPQAAIHVSKWAVQRVLPYSVGWRSELLRLADALLPNSTAEARQLITLFGADPKKIRVVPNGVEERFADASPKVFRDWHGEGEFVLYVGRIEPRKNVLGLITASKSESMPIVLIGDAPPGCEDYHAACRAAGEGCARWHSAVPHEDPFLASAYASARVVALPSWFETPGLAALEGALAGRAVVVTSHGSAREYFGTMVEYARPGRPGEVAEALAKAWRYGPDPHLASHVRSKFLWSEVARRTAEVYEQVAR